MGRPSENSRRGRAQRQRCVSQSESVDDARSSAKVQCSLTRERGYCCLMDERQIPSVGDEAPESRSPIRPASRAGSTIWSQAECASWFSTADTGDRFCLRQLADYSAHLEDFRAAGAQTGRDLSR